MRGVWDRSAVVGSSPESEMGWVLVTVKKMQGGGWRKLEPASLLVAIVSQTVQRTSVLFFCQTCCPHLPDTGGLAGSGHYSAVLIQRVAR